MPPPTELPGPPGVVVPVSLLVNTARLVIERHLPLSWVSGEISNYVRAASGHWYFNLKDASAQVRCVFFRQRNLACTFALRDGLAVEIRASATVYEARGEFQLTVESVRLAGIGQLYEAYNRLKARLEAAGWFAQERKRVLPAFPRCVGVVTSPSGAAVRDVVTTLARRFPGLPVIVYPTLVQGDGAAAAIARAIETAGARGECDVLILCRGGGSIEDLWAFNEEVTARAVRDCPIPVVSGVGHETDFTICDFVADVRAPTPTGAAMLVAPDRQALLARVAALRDRGIRAADRQIERAMQRLDIAARRLRHPRERIAARRAQLEGLAQRFVRAGALTTERAGNRLLRGHERWRRFGRDIVPDRQVLRGQARLLDQAAAARLRLADLRVSTAARSLALLSPLAVLERGYAIVTDAAARVVSDAGSLRVGETVDIRFARDRIDAVVAGPASPAPQGAADAGTRPPER